MKKKVESYKARLQMASKFAEQDYFNKLIGKVNAVTHNFILSQTKNQNRKSKGHRFTIDDKILALSIFKQSPKGYKYLSTIFSLPSQKTIMTLLKNIPFLPGINSHIIQHIKSQVEILSPLERKCSVLFDEMALEAKLYFDKYNDCIFGFEDFGYNRKSLKFADHVLVFMVRGIKKKFKQPICYYYVKGTTPTKVLVNCIKEVLSNLYTVGLDVVTTVSDQGVTNVAAINFLKNESQTSSGTNNEHISYLINGNEVIHVYDPPHLLKGIRNNLLTKDVEFTWQGESQRASWKFIQNLYKLDKDNEIYGYRALPKLTESHIDPKKIKKMKVSMAAQVFSHRIASTMKLMCDLG